ncbi:MAG TPA: SUF system NifU family Fe-S cluster assembly protein [Thermoanaerobaculia bacterium]|nr:SUF system NifU family Fe-S cluster assembly protein [Thermoanaerobaculia bacterium]
MSDLRELYQEIILDHNRRPRNFGALKTANRRAEGNNPLCGDQITLYLDVEDEVIRDVSFEGSGCAISTASASLMTDTLKGKTVAEARDLFARFHGLVAEPPAAPGGADPDLGKLAVFSGVREYPMRVKCATLAWHTMKAALESRDRPVTTDEEGA